MHGLISLIPAADPSARTLHSSPWGRSSSGKEATSLGRGGGHLSKVLRSVQLLPGDPGFPAKCRRTPQDLRCASNKSAKRPWLSTEVLGFRNASWLGNSAWRGGCGVCRFGGRGPHRPQAWDRKPPPCSVILGSDQGPWSQLPPPLPHPRRPLCSAVNPTCLVFHPGTWSFPHHCLEYSAQELKRLAACHCSHLRQAFCDHPPPSTPHETGHCLSDGRLHAGPEEKQPLYFLCLV